jgi:hypothetical protein
MHLAIGAIAPPRVHDVGGDTVSYFTSFGWVVRLVLAAAASLGFVLGPGFVLRGQIRAGSFLANPAFLWVPGALYLGVVGIAAWLLGSLPVAPAYLHVLPEICAASPPPALATTGHQAFAALGTDVREACRVHRSSDGRRR